MVALDPSLQMLRVAHSHGLLVAAGAVPGLPFGADTFDGVMANFVLSHVSSHQAALADMGASFTARWQAGCDELGLVQK